MGGRQSVCASSRSGIVDRAVRFAARQTVLQLRAQCTIPGHSANLLRVPIAALGGARNPHVLVYTPVSLLRPPCTQAAHNDFQYALCTYFPIIRTRTSGTGMQKELLNGNDFFPAGQRPDPFFSRHPSPLSCAKKPLTLEEKGFPAFRIVEEGPTFFLRSLEFPQLRIDRRQPLGRAPKTLVPQDLGIPAETPPSFGAVDKSPR